MRGRRPCRRSPPRSRCEPTTACGGRPLASSSSIVVVSARRSSGLLPPPGLLVVGPQPADRRARGSGRPAPAARHACRARRSAPSSRNRIWSACISELSRCAMMMRHPVPGEAPHRRADALLGAGVDRRGGIVEHHHRRAAASGCARSTGAAAGRRRATRRARRRRCRSRVGRPDDVVVQLRRTRLARSMRGSLRPGIAVGDVVLDRGREQERCPAAPRRPPGAAIAASPSRMSCPSMVIAPEVDVVEARDQVRDRRLAAARRADDADASRRAAPRS